MKRVLSTAEFIADFGLEAKPKNYPAVLKPISTEAASRMTNGVRDLY